MPNTSGYTFMALVMKVALAATPVAYERCHLELRIDAAVRGVSRGGYIASYTDDRMVMSDAAKGALAYCFFFSLIAYALGFRPQMPPASSLVWFLLPLVPLARFIFSWWRFPKEMMSQLDEGEIGQEGPRAVHLTLAGFSFAAYFVLVAEAVKAAGTGSIDLSLSVYYVFVSFIAFFAVFLLDAYSFTRWTDEFRSCLLDAGRLTLLASSVALVWQTGFALQLKWAISIIAFLGWFLNFAMHWYLTWCFFAGRPVLRILQGRAAGSGGAS